MLARIQWRNAEPRVLGGAGHLISWALCRASGEGLQWAWSADVKWGIGHCLADHWEPSSAPLFIVHHMHQTSSTHVLLIVSFLLGNCSPSELPQHFTCSSSKAPISFFLVLWSAFYNLPLSFKFFEIRDFCLTHLWPLSLGAVSVSYAFAESMN